MAIAVVTRAYDNTRAGANTQESVLTASAVANRGLRRRQNSLVVQGDKLGMECQPLVVPDVTLDDGSVREVIYCATMSNQVYAFDAADGTELWSRTLGPPVKSVPDIDANKINDHWGILSTPVIDPATSTMYVVPWVSADGSVANAQHFVHGISLTDGRDVDPAVKLEDFASYDPGHGRAARTFKSAPSKQRPALLLTSVGGVKTLFIGFGFSKEPSSDERGWIIACSTDPLAYSTAWATTASGAGGGIWQAGAGLAADQHGFIYAMTGNGAFDGVTDFSESFVKLKYIAGASPSLTLADWWTPWTDALRTKAQAAPDVADPMPTNFRSFSMGDGFDPGDMDLGSGGPVLAANVGAVVGAGKDGILYVVNQSQMGKTAQADLADPAKAAANYLKLKSHPPFFFTYFPGDGVDAAPADIRDLDNALNGYFDNRSHHQHGNPVYWESPDLEPMLYCWGENGNLRAWSITNTGAVSFLANSAEVASTESPIPPGGMPGGMLTLSADGAQPHTGILWASIPYGDANTAVTWGRLLAYDATRFDKFPDGSNQLRVLWDSQTENVHFRYNKFTPPVVANGRVLVATYDRQVDVYELA